MSRFCSGWLLAGSCSTIEAHGATGQPLGDTGPSPEAAKIADEDSLSRAGVPSSFLMMPALECLEVEAGLRIEVGDVVRANDIYQDLVRHNPDQW